MAVQYEKVKEYIREHLYQICIAASIILISVVCFWNAGQQNRLRNVADEVGYWGIAAQMAGYDWEDIMSSLPYYSFGYSFLLVPMFWLHRLGLGMAACYKVAIALNVVMLDLAFLLALKVAEKWAPKVNRYYRVLCVLAVTLYPNNIKQSNSAWTEIYIYFLFWGILALAIKVFEEEKIFDVISLVLISFYLFTVHMRMIAVPIAVILVIGLWFFGNRRVSKRKKIKVGLAAAGVFLLALIGVLAVMAVIQNNIYNIQGSGAGAVNTLANSIANITSFFHLDRFKDLMLGFLGKLYYQGIASYLFSFVGMGILFRRVYIGYKKKKENPQGKIVYTQYYFSILVLLAAIGSFMVSAIFMSDSFVEGIPKSPRADRVIYGRYTEFLVSVLMLVAILYLGQIKNYGKLIMFSIICMAITSFAVQYQWDIISFYHEITGGGGENIIDRYFQEDYHNAAFYAAGIATGIFGAICLTCMGKNIISRKIARGVVVTSMLLIFVISGVSSTKTLPKYVKDKTIGSVVELLQLIPEAPIYCIGVPNVDIQILQWELPERSIHVVGIEQLHDIRDEEAVVISPVNHVIIGQVSTYEKFLYSSGSIAVYANQNTDTGKILCESVAEARREVDKTVGEVDLASAVGECGYQRANGQIYYNGEYDEGFMTHGTGLRLNDGVYEFTVDLEIKDLEGSEIGYILGTNAEKSIVKSTDILPDNIKIGGKISVIVEVAVENYLEPLVQVYSYGKCEMKVTGITYKQVASETPRSEEELDELRRILEIMAQEQPGLPCTYYIDSDGSGVSGEPNIMAGEFSEYTEEEWRMYQLPTLAPKYLESKEKCAFIFEKTGDKREMEEILEGFSNRYETKHFILYISS